MSKLPESSAAVSSRRRWCGFSLKGQAERGGVAGGTLYVRKLRLNPGTWRCLLAWLAEVPVKVAAGNDTSWAPQGGPWSKRL